MVILNGDYIYFAASFSVSFPFVMLAMDVGNPPSPRGVVSAGHPCPSGGGGVVRERKRGRGGR